MQDFIEGQVHRRSPGPQRTECVCSHAGAPGTCPVPPAPAQPFPPRVGTVALQPPACLSLVKRKLFRESSGVCDEIRPTDLPERKPFVSLLLYSECWTQCGNPCLVHAGCSIGFGPVGLCVWQKKPPREPGMSPHGPGEPLPAWPRPPAATAPRASGASSAVVQCSVRSKLDS